MKRSLNISLINKILCLNDFIFLNINLSFELPDPIVSGIYLIIKIILCLAVFELLYVPRGFCFFYFRRRTASHFIEQNLSFILKPGIFYFYLFNLSAEIKIL